MRVACRPRCRPRVLRARLGLDAADPFEQLISAFALGHLEVVEDAAVEEADDPLAAAGEDGVVGGDHDGHAAGGAEFEQEVEDLAAGTGVEVAGRLVREEEDRIADQCAGDRDPLLLTAGQLGGKRLLAAGEADRVEQRAGAGVLVEAGRSGSSGAATLSTAVKAGRRWKRWKTKPIRRR